MSYAFTPLVVCIGANALVAHDATTCVKLMASGGVSGILNQSKDGQNRIGGNHLTGCYCLSNGGFTDSLSRGCILTPPTTQFQCDVGAKPTTGFAISSGGSVIYSGNSKFYTKCVEISLSSAGSCGASSPPPATPSPPAMPAPAPKPVTPVKTCPADLNGNYQYPHLIVPGHSDSPNKPYGTSYFSIVNNNTCSIFNFDVPASYSGKTCSLVFLFPVQKDLRTSSFTTSGQGSVQVSMLNSPADMQTCWNNQPSKGMQLCYTAILPGNSYTVWSGACPSGQRVGYEICSAGGYALNYFQDYNLSPIGMYMRQC